MIERREFEVEGGDRHRRWLFVPEPEAAPRPLSSWPMAMPARRSRGSNDSPEPSPTCTTTGIRSERRRSPSRCRSVALERLFDKDEHAQFRGEPPRRQRVVGDDLTVLAAYRAKDAISFYLQPMPPAVWTNEVTVRSTLQPRLHASHEGDSGRSGALRSDAGPLSRSYQSGIAAKRSPPGDRRHGG